MGEAQHKTADLNRGWTDGRLPFHCVLDFEPGLGVYAFDSKVVASTITLR
jgi:hypothetical protein